MRLGMETGMPFINGGSWAFALCLSGAIGYQTVFPNWSNSFLSGLPAFALYMGTIAGAGATIGGVATMAKPLYYWAFGSFRFQDYREMKTAARTGSKGKRRS